MDDGWTVVSSKEKLGSKKNAQQKKKTTSNAPKKAAVEEPIPVLNDVFDMKKNSSPSDMDDSDATDRKVPSEDLNVWTTVSTTKKLGKKNQGKKAKMETAKLKPVEKKAATKVAKTEAQILREKDERRARREFKTGDNLLYYYPFLEQDVKATIISTTAEILTFSWDGMQYSLERNDPDIKLIWNEKSKCYYPLPKKDKKKKKKKSPEPETKQEKKKKPRKKGPKKITSETAIIEKVSSIIQTLGVNDKLGLPEVMNHLRDHLQGGSWNQKKYKGKFGGMKKFLQKHSSWFVVEDVNGNPQITRLPPPAPKQKKTARRKSAKSTNPRKQSEGSSHVFMFFLAVVVCFVLLFLANKDDSIQILKKIQGRLQEFITSSHSNKEL